MSLEIRRKSDGTLKSKYWYGAFMVDGKRHVKNLGVQIAGTPPASLRKDGDAAFERSRGEAKRTFEQAVAGARSSKSSEAMLQELHEIKYGAKVESFPITDLVKAWESMPKKRRETERPIREGREGDAATVPGLPGGESSEGAGCRAGGPAHRTGVHGGRGCPGGGG